MASLGLIEYLGGMRNVVIASFRNGFGNDYIQIVLKGNQLLQIVRLFLLL